MTPAVLGSLFKFEAEGMAAMAGVTNNLNQMNQSVDNLVKKGAEIGSFFEGMAVQLKAFSGNSEQAFNSLQNFISAMAVEVPYAYREVLSGMREFKMLGIDVQKTYGQISNAGKQMTIDSGKAIGGLAAKVGAGFEQTAHNIRAAIAAGRANYLEYWVGSLEAQMMQMQGIFVGTYQMQYDKLMTYLGKRYSKLSKELAQTLTGTRQNFTDFFDYLWQKGLQVGIKGGLIDTIASNLSGALDRLMGRNEQGVLTGFWVEALGGTNRAEMLGRKLREVFDPFLNLLNKVATKLVDIHIIMSRWILDPKNAVMVNLFARVAGFVAIIAVGWGAIKGLGLFLSGVAVPVFKFLLSDVGVGGLFKIISSIITIGGGILPILGAFITLLGVMVITGTKWNDISAGIRKVFDWITEQVRWLANFVTIFMNIMLNTSKGAAQISRAAWEGLGPESQGFMKDIFRMRAGAGEWIESPGKKAAETVWEGAKGATKSVASAAWQGTLYDLSLIDKYFTQPVMKLAAAPFRAMGDIHIHVMSWEESKKAMADIQSGKMNVNKDEEQK